MIKLTDIKELKRGMLFKCIISQILYILKDDRRSFTLCKRDSGYVVGNSSFFIKDTLHKPKERCLYLIQNDYDVELIKHTLYENNIKEFEDVF